MSEYREPESFLPAQSEEIGDPLIVHAEGSPDSDPARTELLTAAVDHWVGQLIDPSRRNSLLYFRDTKTTTLRAESAPEDVAHALISGRSVDLDTLRQPDHDGDDAERAIADIRKRARGIFRISQSHIEEQGLETLFLGLGMATWNDGGAEKDRRPASPVLLLPTDMKPRGVGGGRRFSVQAVGEVIVNPVLLHALELMGTKLSPEDLVSGIEGMEDGEPGITSKEELEVLFSRLRSNTLSVSEFSVADARVLGNFSYYKQAMVRDLQEFKEGVIGHDLIAALAGHAAAQTKVTAHFTDPDPSQFDSIDAKARHLILDADSSQEAAVRRVLDGQSVVIQGPPGTGKSQTIANIAGALTAAGRNFLFVAEKRAALEAVSKRLVNVGLGHLILDLHGRGITRRDLAKQLAAALEGIRKTVPEQNSDLYREHDRTTERLVEHFQRMHTPRAPTGYSIDQMRSKQVRTPESARWEVALTPSDLEELSSRREEFENFLSELREFSDLLSGTADTPWTDVSFEQADFRHIHGQATDAAVSWKAALAESASIGLRLDEDYSVDGVSRLAHALKRQVGLMQHFSDDVWELDLEAVARPIRSAGNSWLNRAWATLTRRQFRQACKALASAREQRPMRPPLKAQIEGLILTRDEWKELGMSRPPDRAILEGLEQAITTGLSKIDSLRQHLPHVWTDEAPGTRLTDDLIDLADDETSGQRSFLLWRKLADLALAFPTLGTKVKSLLESPPRGWSSGVDYVLATNAYRLTVSEDATIEGFEGVTHQQHVASFQSADRALLTATARQVGRAHGEAFIAMCDRHPEEYQTLRREAEKKRRHKSLRQLMDEAPNVLSALFPCWMASPLSVSQLLSPKAQFDVVLFDEASQVFPWDAVPSVLRARQLVVAGDRNQMPPTNFFLGSDENAVGDDVSEFEGFESVLAQASAFLPDSHLNWHYRSRDERLIAFANHHIYRGSLVTFPGAGLERPPLHADVVEPAPHSLTDTSSAPAEVERVVELVLEHAAVHPNQSLGVIAPGVQHARRIEHALDRALEGRSDLDKFFDPEKEERFFVKNIEQVQGDERDAIILSVGYAKDAGGNLSHNFGPITHETGHRRLNVAVTRARAHMAVVSSFSWRDVDLSRSKARGTRFLKDFLRYAESGGRLLSDDAATEEPMNSWELEVFDRLSAEGLELVPQYGSSGFRIDMVAKHPDRPGDFVLAIECDGASYHSSRTARERDRLRQQILENLGWRFHRIWSTDWWNDSQNEVRKVLDAFQRALRNEPVSEASTLEYLADERTSPARPYWHHDVPKGLSISEYDPEELEDLACWINCDGRLRTEDEVVEEMIVELGFKRRGARIIRELRRAARAASSS